MYFVICPKLGPKMEGVVLNRIGILGIFSVPKRVRVSDPQWHPETQTLVKCPPWACVTLLQVQPYSFQKIKEPKLIFVVSHHPVPVRILISFDVTVLVQSDWNYIFAVFHLASRQRFWYFPASYTENRTWCHIYFIPYLSSKFLVYCILNNKEIYKITSFF